MNQEYLVLKIILNIYKIIMILLIIILMIKIVLNLKKKEERRIRFTDGLFSKFEYQQVFDIYYKECYEK